MLHPPLLSISILFHIFYTHSALVAHLQLYLQYFFHFPPLTTVTTHHMSSPACENNPHATTQSNYIYSPLPTSYSHFHSLISHNFFFIILFYFIFSLFFIFISPYLFIYLFYFCSPFHFHSLFFILLCLFYFILFNLFIFNF